MSHWMTPEEIERKKRRRKILFYLVIPIIGGLIGALITIFISAL